ncbi:MAG: NAD-dependent epimerase/dehydratase family protein [Candidatus Izemoplasmatales bacterium]
MNVLIIGGTGLLGLAGAKELIRRGHNVKTISLPDLPKGLILPEKLEVVYENYETMSDNELRKHLRNQEALVFAAGVDGIIEQTGPAYEFYKSKNITPLNRLLKLAKEMKLKKAIICGSYFTYLDRVWENLYLYETHPYIKSRVDQSNEAFSFYDKDFAVTVLEIPYVFDDQEGRKPVWVLLIEQIKKMKIATFYPKGGTAMITVNQVGQVIASSVETAKGAKTIPVGYYNLTWRKMLKIMHKHMGIRKRPIISIPKWLYKLVLLRYKRRYKKQGIELGINLNGLAEIMTRKAYINNTYLKEVLKVKDDSLDQAIGNSVKFSLEIINNDLDTIKTH